MDYWPITRVFFRCINGMVRANWLQVQDFLTKLRPLAINQLLIKFILRNSGAMCIEWLECMSQRTTLIYWRVRWREMEETEKSGIWKWGNVFFAPRILIASIRYKTLCKQVNLFWIRKKYNLPFGASHIYY